MFEKYFEGLRIVVDQTRDDCNKERPHCHVLKNGRRVAQINCEGYVYALHSDLSDEQTKRVEEFVEMYASDIVEEYNRNASKW